MIIATLLTLRYFKEVIECDVITTVNAANFTLTPTKGATRDLLAIAPGGREDMVVVCVLRLEDFLCHQLTKLLSMVLNPLETGNTLLCC